MNPDGHLAELLEIFFRHVPVHEHLATCNFDRLAGQSNHAFDASWMRIFAVAIDNCLPARNGFEPSRGAIDKYALARAVATNLELGNRAAVRAVHSQRRLWQ